MKDETNSVYVEKAEGRWKLATTLTEHHRRPFGLPQFYKQEAMSSAFSQRADREDGLIQMCRMIEQV